MRTNRARGPFLVTIAVICGCTGNTVAPVFTRELGRPATPMDGATEKKLDGSKAPAEQRKPNFYVISHGDTLYSIAWRFGMDYKTLAAWNSISDPTLIHPGQKLRLTAPELVSRQEPLAVNREKPPLAPPVQPDAARLPATPAAVKSNSPPQSTIIIESALPPPTNTAVRVDKELPSPQEKAAFKLTDGVRWQWPAQGTVIKPDTLMGKKGIYILGATGQTVSAAAPGKVVYSGSGLRGYGKLIIVKHNDVYLSAYAHNSKLLVDEGAAVSGGQAIAEMGRSDVEKVMLHFEIRKNGKPVEPLHYLPKRL